MTGRNTGMLRRVPPRRIDRAGYRSELRVALVVVVVAGVSGKLSPSFWTSTWTDGWHEPRVCVGGAGMGLCPRRPQWPSHGDADSDFTGGSVCAVQTASGTANAAVAESSASTSTRRDPGRPGDRWIRSASVLGRYASPRLMALAGVAVAHRRLGPSSSAMTSTVERALPSSAVQAAAGADPRPRPGCPCSATRQGAVALRRGGTRWSCELRPDQMANASSWNAAATRRFVGSSAASS
jgi:hypothetical protein